MQCLSSHSIPAPSTLTPAETACAHLVHFKMCLKKELLSSSLLLWFLSLLSIYLFIDHELAIISPQRLIISTLCGFLRLICGVIDHVYPCYYGRGEILSHLHQLKYGGHCSLLCTVNLNLPNVLLPLFGKMWHVRFFWRVIFFIIRFFQKVETVLYTLHKQ